MKYSRLIKGYGSCIYIVILAVMVLASPVSAALGESEKSVHADRERMNGVSSRIPADTYTVHEIRAANGTLVREYVAAGGLVFGVVWDGPFIPDLQQLLGSYFQQYKSAVMAEKAKRQGRRPLNIQLPGLIVQTSGHMRSYYGRAYVPGMVPPGVSADVIK